MCDVDLPLPSMDKQAAIIKIFSVLEKRKKLNAKLIEIQDIFPPTIMQGVRSGLVMSVR